MNITKVVLEADSTSIKTAKKDLDALQGSGEQAQKSVTGLGTAAKAASSLIAGLAASFGIREVIQYADEWQNASNRLRLVTTSSQELAQTQQILLRVANETRAGFSSTAELFTVLTRSTRDLGLSQAEIVDITKTLNQSFAVSGASASSMEGAIRQLSQGLQSGALRGDEFNSVAEQAPGILDAVAASLKISKGELREFAATGGITSQVLIKAIQDYADVIESDFGKAQRTYAQSLQEARNNALEFVGSSKLVLESTQAAGNTIVALSKNLDLIGVAAGAVALVFSARLAAGIVASTQATIANISAVATATTVTDALGVRTTVATAQQNLMAAATGKLNSALALVGGPVGALVIAAGALVYFVSKMESATESTARMIDELDTLHKEELQRGIEIQKTYIQGIETQIERMGRQNQSVAAVRERMAELRTRLEEATKDLQRMNNGMRDIEERDFDALVDEMTGGMISYASATNQGANATEELASSTNALVNMMDAAAYSAQNTASNYLKLITAHGAVIPSIDQVTTRTTRLTEEQKNANLINRDAQDSIDGIVDSMEKQKEVSPQLVEVTNLMRNDISSAFADMMMNGENAFDAIAKSFERMIYKMIADWAAGKIMDLVSGAFSAATGGFTALLSGLGSAVSSTVGAAISGSIGAGTAAVTGGTAAAGTGAAIAAGTAGAGAVAGTGAALAGTAAAGGTAATVFATNAATSAAGLTTTAIGAGGAATTGATAATTTAAAGMGTAAALAAVGSVFVAIAAGLNIGQRMNEETREELREEWRDAEQGLQALGINPTEMFSEDSVAAMLAASPEFAGMPGANVADLSQQLISGTVRRYLFDPTSYGQLDGSHYSGLDYVPYDGYRMEAHQGEAVITARGNEALGLMAGALEEMRDIMAAVAAHTSKAARQLERWDFDGLPETRVFA